MSEVNFLDYDGLQAYDAQNKTNYRKTIKTETDKVKELIGNIGLLTTTNKTNLVNAINEIKATGGDGVTSGGLVSIEEGSELGFYKTFTFSQNNSEIGKIKLFNNENLQSGFVYKKGGKIYLKLVYLINGEVEKEVLIDVSSIAGSGTSSPGGGSSESGGVNFTPEENATEIQLILENGILSATLVNGSITSDKIADNNIGGEKIIDKSITASKIADETLTLSQCSPELASMIKSAATPISGKMFFITADEYKALEQSGNIQEEALYFITTEV